MEQEDTCRPVPAPRRLYPELRKLDYENVTVELINKNLNINSENLHTVTNCTEKVPNNKIFFGSHSDLEDTASTRKSILTETNDLYGPNANETVATPGPIYSTPTPAPRPRKPQNTDVENANNIYENTEVLHASPQTTPTLYPELPNSTRAISKENSPNTSTSSSPSGSRAALRKAPVLPPKTYLSAERERCNRAQRYSIGSEVSTTSSYNVTIGGGGARAGVGGLDDCAFGIGYTQKSASNATLNSSVDESNDSGDNSKFKSPSPGELLKSIGSTSKLLTESIGERVALKAKGVKNKFDKNFSNISSETANRLRSVGKNFNTNFTLTKKDKEKPKEVATAQFHTGRPQTLPPNDQVFGSISFTSPLNRKADAVDDLSASTADCSYDLPRSLKLTRSDLDLPSPPSYEDALKTAPQPAFERNAPVSKSLMVPKHIAAEAANVALKKQRSNASLQNVAEEESATGSSSVANSRDSLDFPSPPMPTFPPPALPKEVVTDITDGLYGRLKPIQPPQRLKRRKNYEEIQLRRVVENPSPVGGASLRPNVDSAELHQLNMEVAASEREESMLLRKQILAAENQMPKPDRSESWEYFADSVEESVCSTPEPVYANDEATYGRVFEMASSSKPNSSQVQPRPVELVEGAVGGCVKPPVEVIKEFDPLLSRKAATICNSDKSNQLLLLEHLLEEDIYGTVSGDQVKSDDDISMCTSEEDNQIATAVITTAVVSQDPTPATVVLPTPTNAKPTNNTNEAGSQLRIVHQNAHLLSESTENMLDDNEARVRPYLSRLEDQPASGRNIDLARASENRTQWFVQDNKENKEQQRRNPFNKLNIEGDGPPSYLEAIGVEDRPSLTANEQKSRASRFMNTMNVFSTNVKQRVGAITRKGSFKVAAKSDLKVTLQMVPRPTLSPLLVRYEGPLIRFPSGVVEDILKEMQNRKAILRDRQFQTFLDQEMKTPKESIPLEYITTLQCVSNSRVTDNSTHFYCFEITMSVPKNQPNSSNVQAMSNPNLVMTSTSSGNCKHQRVAHLYGVSKESERGVWMQKLLESLTNTIPPKYACHYYRAGWCYLKNSITSEWSGTWLVLKKNQRRLIFVSEAAGNVEKMDLRKARCIVLKDSDETIRNLHVESGPTLMIDCPPFTVYMIMSSPRETKIWRHIIREVAHNNGFSLIDQQLTKFNVPVIVDKCINFVYIHGSMSEGIYRKSGSENSILKLLSAFRADAFNVEITRNEYNEHDVANVLKRFMRDLPERLMGKLSESFMCVTELTKPAEKIEVYKELLARLSVIERETLKKIVGHLAFISSQKAKNKMSTKNLTMIWGPTLLQNHQQEEMVYSQKEADVLADLITLYKHLFPLSPEEVTKEQEMLMCLQKYYAAAETLTDSVKKSGDLKMWVVLNPRPENTKEEKVQVNVTITPTRTAYDICRELASKMQFSTHQVSLHEVILNDSLERPLHHDTKVFDVVLNWSYWPEDDRKNNYLVVKPIDTLREVQRAVKNLATVTPGKELKFADYRTKSFKSFLCELRDGKIVISKKDKNEKTTIVREIFLHSTTAYLGCEKKRDFPWSWAITFVERTQTQILRSRDSPFIGHVLAGSEWVDRTIWFSSIWYSLYGDNILPPAEIIMK
ncbi:uncharacterized protein LOC118733786 isoform X1 [Rhagoletis pomonella]|uniref:uncharacterized protein LOC118733786 isoform X1 n=1 Tax=Rhagoletis pomonella TaxID=28610 RepID=UPI00177DA91D|nr:uncharacterized protein LOC118733786 isoform X1 [Rhagoletis pomonella]XP_036319244.1 uncharacterized protein LOC118733786 isoform X1 [Rhagoletis pomonella]XP_036319245.1 uncharacterized protein LOC118733786 isoform X1 [Rhagoletis pomonella]XP_036319246.1 uncharacterized protein LOC118733786 isoform X1 [Rhagoletis pomonella]